MHGYYSLHRTFTHHSVISGCRIVLLMTSLKLYSVRRDSNTIIVKHEHGHIYRLYILANAFKGSLTGVVATVSVQSSLKACWNTVMSQQLIACRCTHDLLKIATTSLPTYFAVFHTFIASSLSQDLTPSQSHFFPTPSHSQTSSKCNMLSNLIKTCVLILTHHTSVSNIDGFFCWSTWATCKVEGKWNDVPSCFSQLA